jgi:hypothetical protein
MDDQGRKWIASLENEFMGPDGFVWQARYGKFDRDRGEAFIRMLSEIRVPDGDLIDKRFVSIIWFIPLMLAWQNERIADQGGDIDGFRRITERATNIIIEILGVP